MTDFVVLSDESVNDQGFRVLTSGIITEHFEKNPVLLYVHERTAKGKAKFPLGRWESLTKTGDGKLIAKPVFDEEDPDGKELARKWKKGFVNMASIHGEVLEWSEDPALMLPGQVLPTITKLLLREGSLADLGSNLNCVRLSYKGKAISLSSNEDNSEVLKALFYSNKTDRSMKNLILKLNSTKLGISLADNASESDVMMAVDKVLGKNSELTVQLSSKEKEIETLKTEKTALEQKIQEVETKAVEDKATVLVEVALSSGKITAKQKDHFVKLAKADYNSTKEILDGMAAHQPIGGQLNQNGGGASSDDKALLSLSKSDKVKKFDEMHKDGSLVSLKARDFEVFSDLFEAKFGKKPNK